MQMRWDTTMDAIIILPSRLYKRLILKSRQLERAPEEIVAELVRLYLSEPDDRWQTEFQALIAHVQARAAAFSSDEIKADITSAAAEAREMRRARRSA